MLDRRRSYRARVQAPVMISLRTVRSRGTLIDLSLGGARIAPAQRIAASPGEPAIVAIGLARWVRVRAVIRRVDEGAIALAHERLDPDVEELIDAAVVAELEAESTPRVVVVDRDAPRRRLLVEAIARAGGRTVEAASALEAISAVEGRTRVRAVAVADELGDLASYLRESHPELRVARLPPDGDVATAVRALFA
jgi:hypothetical protein